MTAWNGYWSSSSGQPLALLGVYNGSFGLRYSTKDVHKPYGLPLTYELAPMLLSPSPGSTSFVVPTEPAIPGTAGPDTYGVMLGWLDSNWKVDGIFLSPFIGNFVSFTQPPNTEPWPSEPHAGGGAANGYVGTDYVFDIRQARHFTNGVPVYSSPYDTTPFPNATGWYTVGGLVVGGHPQPGPWTIELRQTWQLVGTTAVCTLTAKNYDTVSHTFAPNLVLQSNIGATTTGFPGPLPVPVEPVISGTPYQTVHHHGSPPASPIYLRPTGGGFYRFDPSLRPRWTYTMQVDHDAADLHYVGGTSATQMHAGYGEYDPSPSQTEGDPVSATYQPRVVLQWAPTTLAAGTSTPTTCGTVTVHLPTWTAASGWTIGRVGT